MMAQVIIISVAYAALRLATAAWNTTKRHRRVGLKEAASPLSISAPRDVPEASTGMSAQPSRRQL